MVPCGAALCVQVMENFNSKLLGFSASVFPGDLGASMTSAQYSKSVLSIIRGLQPKMVHLCNVFFHAWGFRSVLPGEPGPARPRAQSSARKGVVCRRRIDQRAVVEAKAPHPIPERSRQPVLDPARACHTY